MILFRKKNCNSINHTPFVSRCFTLFSAQKSHKTLKSDIQSLFLRQILNKHQLEVRAKQMTFWPSLSYVGEYLVISLSARHDMSLLSNNIKQVISINRPT